MRFFLIARHTSSWLEILPLICTYLPALRRLGTTLALVPQLHNIYHPCAHTIGQALMANVINKIANAAF